MTQPAPRVRSKHWHISQPVRVIGYVFAALLLAYFILVVVFSTSWFKGLMLERTRARLETLTGTRVDIGRMQINPWVLQLTLQNLVMHGTETGNERPLFTARQLVMRASIRTMLHRRALRLARLEVEGATIHLYTQPDGSTNLPGPAAQMGNLKALDDLVDLGVGHLLLVRSTFSWNNLEWPLDLNARGLAVVLGMRQGAYGGSISADSFQFSNPNLSLPATTVATRIGLGKNSLRLEGLVWRSPAFSGSGTLDLHWLPSLESGFSFRLEGQIASLARVFARDDVHQGTFAADLQGAYRDGAIDAHGHVDARHVTPTQLHLESGPLELSADYRVQGRRLRLPKLTLSLLGGTASGSAEAGFATRTPSFEANLNLQNFDVARTVAALPQGRGLLGYLPVASRAAGRLRLSGQGSKAESRYDLQLSSSGYPAQGREPVTGVLRGTATFGPLPSVSFEVVDLHTVHSALKLRGSAGGSGIAMSVQMQTNDFREWKRAAEFVAQKPLPARLESTAKFSGTLSGSLAHPLVTGRFETGEFEYQTWKWEGLQASITAGPAELRVTSGQLLGAQSALAFNSTVTLQNWQSFAGAPFEISAHAGKTSIEGLREVLGIATPLSGEITGDLHVLEDRNELSGSTSFLITSGSYSGETFDSLAAALSVDRGTWRIQRFNLGKGRGQMTGSGTFDPASGRISARAQGRRFALADLRQLRNLAPAASPGGFAGTLSFDLAVNGSQQDLSPQGEVQIQGLEMAGIALGSLTGQLQTIGRELTLRGQFQGPGGKLDFQGNTRMGGWQDLDWPVTLSAHYRGLRLDPWMRALGLTPALGTVDATGSFDYSGSLGGTASPHLNSEVDDVEVSFAGLQWRNARPFNISLEKQRLEITPFTLQGPSTEFRFEGTADLKPVPALNLRAEGQIDAQFLHVFDPALQTTGRFGVQASVQGSFRHPLLYGSLTVDQVSIGYPGLPVRLAGLKGDVELQGDRLTVRSLRAENGPASVSITGSVTLAGAPRYNLRADFSHLRIAYPLQFVSVVSGTGRLTGSPGAGVLSGNFTVEQMFVSENFNVLNWASTLAAQQAPTPGTRSPLPSGVRLDVRVASSPTVSVESHDLSAVASIDLSLRGTLSDPVVFGNVHVQSGSAVLRQTNYKLTHGDIILANPLRTEPVLDLEATTRIQQYDLVLRITGPAGHPNISYRSDPPLSTPNILALLAFGYSTQDQMMANTGRSSFSTQGASAILSQALSSQVSSRVTRLFGLSRISIDPNPISTGGTQVTVEERLAHDFTITYVTTTGGIVERIIRVEWDLSDSMSLLGIRDQNGVYGFELDFRKRFK
ncbi:MAG TPA: translocation/assembly module TamB domain-containing protein [Terriglobia bacterium]|nr:translocation/assembly module TamB domain-containing protein [Terriglobia bacterium]